MTTNEPTDSAEPTEPTEPAEPVDDAERIALLWNGFTELTARLDTTDDAVADALETLGGAVADLKTQLTALLKKERDKDVPPRRWADRATAKDWDTLVDWVDRLTADYSLLGDYTIPPCWPAHPGVVEELAGLHRAWIRALINDQLGKKDGGNDLTAWHDRWLWPCLRRMKAGHYRTTNCRDRHQPERRSTSVTNRSSVPSRISECSPPDSPG